jgi:uncharacterized protein (DUF2236 family)
MPPQPLRLPGPVQRWVERLADELLAVPGLPPLDFAAPAGEPALVSPGSVSWRVFANPVTLFIGGVAAVLLELGEPRVRHGVWDHSGFRVDPVMRLRRTGLAAMVTVYGAESAARAMIAGVNRLHARVAGVTADDVSYRADDPELLEWVQATASWGFLQAFIAFDRPLPAEACDAYYAEAVPAAALYGATGAPRSQAGIEALFAAMAPRLEPSATIFEFLQIMRRAPILPAAARPLQRLLVSAAIALLPPPLASRLGLAGKGLKPWQRPLVTAVARFAGRLPLAGSPAVQASRRLGLPADHLYRS